MTTDKHVKVEKKGGHFHKGHFHPNYWAKGHWVTPSLEITREYYQRKPRVRMITICIAVVSPFVGVFLAGVIGLLGAIALSILSFVLGPGVVLVREITRERL